MPSHICHALDAVSWDRKAGSSTKLQCFHVSTACEAVPVHIGTVSRLTGLGNFDTSPCEISIAFGFANHVDVIWVSYPSRV
jgi:hypothetical protein